MKKSWFIVFGSLILFATCTRDPFDPPVNDPNADLEDIDVDRSFDYSTTSDVELAVGVLSLEEVPLDGVKVSVFNAHPDFGGHLLGKAFTNESGIAQFSTIVPADLEEVIITVGSVGFNNLDTFKVQPFIDASFGGKPAGRVQGRGVQNNGPIHISDNYYYMGTYDNGSGLPHYLESPGDQLDQSFLDDVNASLPEYAPVPQNNPEYLSSSNELDVVVEQLSDVWVTFVSEGAGYRNSLGFYKFPTGNPPASAADIDSIFVVLPNASLQNSGGALNAGDKVHLGLIEGGTTISWVLFEDAWQGNRVEVDNQKWYSNNNFNNEHNPDQVQHTVQLYDADRGLLLNGFEDVYRSSGHSDEDFNDLIFYVSANPFEAIASGAMPPITNEGDGDGDGIPNSSDEFPDNPFAAGGTNYTGSIAFEDLWPGIGDYDFNDLVINYNINHTLNANNDITEIQAVWGIRAVGGSYQNGFGFQLDNVPATNVSSISGQNLSEGYINTNGNGTETGINEACVIVFDNVFNVMPSSGGSFINTVPGATEVPVQTMTNIITFNQPQDPNDVGFPPYNAFIIANGERGREIHLANEKPTSLANTSLFGNSADRTNPNQNVYYKTNNGLPWGLNVTEGFVYPSEKSKINQGYEFFNEWCISAGGTYQDWHRDKPNYRVAAKLYKP
jgi:LruC domain-containing protein